MKIDEWLYFGCGTRQLGHYLFRERGGSTGAREWDRFGRFDGRLAPNPEGDRYKDVLYEAALSRLGNLGMSALSWWDQSKDSRPASNSIIFAPHIDIPPTTMCLEAQVRFPWVFARLPKPLVLLPTASV